MSTCELTKPAVGRRFERPSWWAVAVWIATAFYSIALSAESIYRHGEYASSFDTAIYDQLLWLLAHGHNAFSSITGRPFLAIHFQPGFVLLTPLYTLGLGVPAMFAVQSVGLALAAPALYALARNRGASPGLATLPAMLWLVSPWTASANLFEFHPDSFVPTLIVLSALFALSDRWALFGLAAVLAQSMKEDVSLTYVMLGALLALHGRVRPGAILAAGSVIWLVLANRIIEWQGNSYVFLEKRFAGDRGNDLLDAFSWMLQHPVQTATDVLGQSGPGVFLLLLATAGLALLARSWLLLSVPSLLENALSAYSEQHSLTVHYHLLPATGMFVAAAIGVRRVASCPGTWRRAFVGMAGLAALIAVTGGVWVHEIPARREKLDAARMRTAASLIPPGVPVAASIHFQPHLSHRVELYTLPEPFVGIDWGGSRSSSELAAEVNSLRFVIMVGNDGPSEYPRDIATVLPLVRRNGFTQIYHDGPIYVLERRGG